MQERRRLLIGMNPADPQNADTPVVKGWQELQERAFELASGASGREPFELEREPATVAALWHESPRPEPALGAPSGRSRRGIRHRQRLDRSGSRRDRRRTSKFEWDMHGGEMGMGNAFGTGSYGMGWCLPRLDEALSALLVDLKERGFLRRTLVVCVGEFGRTPRINAQAPIQGGSTGPLVIRPSCRRRDSRRRGLRRV